MIKILFVNNLGGGYADYVEVAKGTTVEKFFSQKMPNSEAGDYLTQVRLQLFVLAYNVGNFLRRLALPNRVKHWSLTTLREKLVKIGAKVISRSRYVTFQMAEVAIPRGLFRAILERIRRLTPQPVVFR